jgi:Cd2+/Zn2+-exporting ATPase
VQVGEGINDAPALAAATVGVVVANCASATSLEVADVLLLGSSTGVSNLPFLTYKVTLTLLIYGGTVQRAIHIC